MTATFFNGLFTSAGTIDEQTSSANIELMRGTVTTDGSLLQLRRADTTNIDLVNAGLPILPLVTKINDYPATVADNVILADAASNTVTITLYTAVNNTGRVLTIKAIDATNTVTVDGAGSETIDGTTTKTILLNDAMKIVSDGANWRII